jgi:transcriptional regulator with XRE-family HTH domain
MKDRARSTPAPDVNARIARRVRGIRAERGLTLDQLAAQCRVSRSMLSLVERGESSPTAVVLDKIASGLDVSLATLFEDAAAPPDPVSRGAGRTAWRDPASGYVRRNVSPAGFPSPLQIVDVVLPPGAHVAYENAGRSAAVHQQVWVREGSVEVTVGNVVHRLGADDCLAMRLDVPTAFRNRPRRPARYAVVLANDAARSTRR